MRRFLWGSIATVFVFALLFVVATLAAEPPEVAAPADEFDVYRKVGLGATAAFAISMCVFGAAHAVARIGAAAIGAAAEKPELLNRSLVFVALAEGLAVLGFVIAMMLVQRI